METIDGNSFFEKVLRVKGILDVKPAPKLDVNDDEDNVEDEEEVTDSSEDTNGTHVDNGATGGDSGHGDETSSSKIEKQLNSQISSIPGLFVSEEERKKTLEKMRKAE